MVNNQGLKTATIIYDSDLVCPCDDEVAPFDLESFIDWSPILKPFLRCPNLDGVDMSCCAAAGKKQPKLADICVAVRGKGISLAICNYQYEGDMTGLSFDDRKWQLTKMDRAPRLAGVALQYCSESSVNPRLARRVPRY